MIDAQFRNLHLNYSSVSLDFNKFMGGYKTIEANLFHFIASTEIDEDFVRFVSACV